MTELSLFITCASKCEVPSPWQTAENETPQRIYYIIKGKGSASFDNGVVTPLEKGKLYLFPSNLRPTFYSDENDKIYHIFFDFYTAPPIISSSPLVHQVTENSPLKKQLNFAETFLTKDIDNLRNIKKIHSAPSGSKEEKMQIKYYLLKMILLLLSSENEIPFINDQVISDSIKYIHKNYSKNITVSDLAKMAGFDKDHYTRRFKKVMRTTPHAYLRDYRFTLAQSLIKNGVTVAKAAEMVGYQHPISLYNILEKR